MEAEIPNNYEYSDFRLYLQGELLKRCERNPSYSLRSFARSLGIHHGTLSQILRGTRPLSENVFELLAAALGLSLDRTAAFRSGLKSGKLDSRGYRSCDLTVDAFAAISDWYHDAILELVNLKEFSPKPKWIAKRLGISVSEVHAAIERLQRLELIQISSDGTWNTQAQRTEIGIDSPFTTSALKKYQKDVLKRGIEAVDQVPRNERHNVSSMVAIDQDDIEEVQRRINKFRRELSKFIQRKESKANSVYQIGICFFPVTKKETV